MTNRADVAHLVDTAVLVFGRIDVLINNPGIMPLSALESVKVDVRRRRSRGEQRLCRQVGISADSFARMAAFAIGQPDDVDVNEIVFRPTAQQL